MSHKFDIGSREQAVKLPNILSVGPYIAKMFPQITPNFNNKIIYHYTTSDGLIGILQTSGIWASNYSFLNDPSERVYCIEKTEEAIHEVQAGRSELVKEMLGRLQKSLHGAGIWTEYIASFCEEGDLLSQWRTYGADASGYSLGFCADRLFWNLAQTASLKKVIYDPALQLNILTEVCEIIAEFIENSYRKDGDVDEHMLDIYSNNCAGPIWSLCSRMKHEAYSEEKEWRRVFLKSVKKGEKNNIFDEQVRFRKRGSTIVPFVNIPFGEARNIQNGEAHYPVRRIVIGPTENSGVAKKGVELLCESINRQINVESSSIPARQF